MIVDPIIFYTLILITTVLTVVLGILVVSYERTLQKTHKAQKENEDLLAHAYDRARQIIEHARKSAFAILERANSQAVNVDKALSEYKEHLLQVQKESLEKDSEKLMQEYLEIIQKLREQNIDIFKTISKDVEKDAELQINDFRQIIEKETLGSQKIVEQKIEEDYRKLQKELEAYKEEKIKAVDDSIYKLLLNVAKLVLGKTISVEDHEQLILDALNKAKKEGILN